MSGLRPHCLLHVWFMAKPDHVAFAAPDGCDFEGNCLARNAMLLYYCDEVRHAIEAFLVGPYRARRAEAAGPRIDFISPGLLKNA